jgi:hypothetical protein
MKSAASTRRQMLWAGGTMTLAVAGGAVLPFKGGSFASPRGDAYAPWDLWNDPSLRGTPLALVAAGILAANPHNTQPWLFRAGDSSIEIFADASRHLGAMDPFLREMHIGLGCAIENMALAAPPNGYALTVEATPGSLVPPGERRAPIHAATLRLKRPGASLAAPPLYEAIPRRHTNRYPYERGQELPAAWRHNAVNVSADTEVRVFLFEEGPERASLDAAIIESTEAIIADATMIGDSDRWLRTSSGEIEKYRSGPTLDTAGLSSLTLLFAKILPELPARVSHDAWLSQTRDRQLATAPVTGMVAIRDRYSRPGALKAGRAWQRLHLASALAGVAVQPLNQPMEMVDREKQLGRAPVWERRLAALTGSRDWQPTFLFRAGIPAYPAPPSPRRALDDALTS